MRNLDQSLSLFRCINDPYLTPVPHPNVASVTCKPFLTIGMPSWFPFYLYIQYEPLPTELMQKESSTPVINIVTNCKKRNSTHSISNFDII